MFDGIDPTPEMEALRDMVLEACPGELQDQEKKRDSVKFLEKFGFEKKDIDALKENSTSALIKELEAHKKLVSKNLEYLNDMGVTNLIEIFVHYHDMFLMDNSNFVEIFNKYDQKDLVSKLAKNVQIMEYL